MSDSKKVFRETTNKNEQRRNPRFPKSSVWSLEERESHRVERDMTIEDAGLVTDRMIEDDDEDKSAG